MSANAWKSQVLTSARIVTQYHSMSSLEKTVSIRVPAGLVKAIDARATRRRLKRADIIREIIWAEIDKETAQIRQVESDEGQKREAFG